ncbi:MAG TPA: hypothetical protein VF505_12230 [Thermoanaerobaculia bacterium]
MALRSAICDLRSAISYDETWEEKTETEYRKTGTKQEWSSTRVI